MRFRNAMVGALAAGALFAGGADADPVKLRMGYVVPGADAPLLMFGKQGIAKHEGASYTLEATRFQGTPPMITALAAGEIDLAPLAFSTVSFAVQNAGMSDLRIIADVFQDGVEGYYTNEYMVAKDSPIKTVEDLKDKIVVSNGAGSAVDMAMRAMLKKHGLEDKRNVTFVEAGFPNMKAMLAEHKVDLISSVRPFSADPGLRDMARTLFTQKEAIGRSEMIILTARQAFLAKNRAAVVDFLEDSLRDLHWYSDPANHDEVVKIVSDYSKIPAPVFQSWLFTKGGDFYHDPNGMPDLDALQSNVATQRDLGFLKADLDVKSLADLSYVQEAAKKAR
ncbi:MAG TPA: ABC transporter substrate-binding protein [Stellaceae bacterium]|nr:ABC transporter substrate-binding protein [Stellaceae bacterium]